MNQPSPEFQEAKTTKLRVEAYALPQPGDRLGDLEIVRFVAEGGFGVVFEAFDVALNRRVALKVPRSIGGPHDVERIQSEAKIAAGLNHPNIVRVFRSFEFEGRPMIVCELIRGTTLGKWLRAQPRSLSQKMRVFRQLASAVAYAHSVGVVHRDLKPGNILVDENDQVFVTDFGLASSNGVDHSHRPDRDGADREHPAQISIATWSPVIGTPGYMAPEQRTQTTTADHRADIFSLGAILFELLTGRPAFEGTESTILKQVQKGLSERHLQLLENAPRELANACIAAMQVQPDHRPESVDALILAVDHWLVENTDAPVLGRVPRATNGARRDAGINDRSPGQSSFVQQNQSQRWLSLLTAAALIYVAVVASAIWWNNQNGSPISIDAAEESVASEQGLSPHVPLGKEGKMFADASRAASKPAIAVTSSAEMLTSASPASVREPELIPVRISFVPATSRDEKEKLTTIRFSRFDFATVQHGVVKARQAQTVREPAWNSPVSIELEPGFYEVEAVTQSGYTMTWFRTIPSSSNIVRYRQNCLNWYRNEDGTVDLPSIQLRKPRPVGKKIIQLDGVRLRPIDSGKLPLTEDFSHCPGSENTPLVAPTKIDVSPFAIGISEVTNSQFERVMGYLPNTRNELSVIDHLPVTNVDFFEAIEFCERAGGRLPTWHEYTFVSTQRGTRAFPWGNDPRFLKQIWRLRDAKTASYDVDPTWRVRGLYSSALEWTASQFVVELKSRKLQEQFQAEFETSRIVVGGPHALLNERLYPTHAFGTAATFGLWPQKDRSAMLGFRMACGCLDPSPGTQRD